MPTCLIALGSNLGNCDQHLRRALAALDQLPQTQVTGASQWLANRPIGGPPGQRIFLNAAARLETELEAHALLSECLRIESDAGRVRRERWAARPLDLDILLYGDRVFETHKLVVPHPWLPVRRYVLEPAAEVAADLQHPVIGWTLGELWRHLTTSAPYFAVVGEDPETVSTTLKNVARRLSVHLLRQRGDDNVSGRPPAREIEFWRRDAGELAQMLAKHPERPVLTGFWWPLLRQRWEETGPPPPEVDFPSCKLLVVFTERHVAEVVGDVPLPPIWQRCQQLRHGPLLRLDSENRERLAHDLIAAIESMQ